MGLVERLPNSLRTLEEGIRVSPYSLSFDPASHFTVDFVSNIVSLTIVHGY